MAGAPEVGEVFRNDKTHQVNFVTPLTCFGNSVHILIFYLFFVHSCSKYVESKYVEIGSLLVCFERFERRSRNLSWSEETYPYYEVALQWHKRRRVMFPCPQTILDTYLPLASATFHNFRDRTADPIRTEGNNDKKIYVLGDKGLNFALTDTRQPCISIEATALFELVQLIPACSSADTPKWIETLQDTWTHDMCLFMFNPANGFRGVFAEHRFWAALLLHRHNDKHRLKTPYSVQRVLEVSLRPLNWIRATPRVTNIVTIEHID